MKRLLVYLFKTPNVEPKNKNQEMSNEKDHQPIF